MEEENKILTASNVLRCSVAAYFVLLVAWFASVWMEQLETPAIALLPVAAITFIFSGLLRVYDNKKWFAIVFGIIVLLCAAGLTYLGLIGHYEVRPRDVYNQFTLVITIVTVVPALLYVAYKCWRSSCLWGVVFIAGFLLLLLLFIFFIVHAIDEPVHDCGC